MTFDENGGELVRRLDALGEANPRLAKAAAIYRAVLPLLLDADLRPSPVPLTRDEARRRLERGIPLLREALPRFDVTAAWYLMVRLARRLQEHSVPGAFAIREALENHRIDMPNLFSDTVSSSGPRAEALARGSGLDPFLLKTLARDAVKPALRVWSRQLASMVEPGTRWEQGYCWACGAPPVFGELRGNGLSRHLRCGLCGGDWPFPRIRCATCGNEDHATLGVLFSTAGPGEARAEYCDRCGGYLKVIVTFEPTETEMIPLQDLATLHLDGIAQQRGYSRVPPPGASDAPPATESFD